MVLQSFRRSRLVLVLACALSFGLVATVTADQSSSTHYMVNETQFGSGSSLQDCSTNYCAKSSAGDTTVGSGSSANYSANFGFNTSDVPLLEVMAIGGNQDLGVLDVSHTGTATASINVRAYLISGYTIQIAGAPPSQGTHALNRITSPSTSQPGAEQFGINLAANTSPSIGANPVQRPSGDFSFGHAVDNYATPNLFSYTNGDIVAQSTSSSGETDYTLSIILNIANSTPGGRYVGNYSAVVVPVF